MATKRPKEPFVPDMSHCVMEIQTSVGVPVYIMDDYCRNFSAEDKKRADAVFLELAIKAERQRRRRAGGVRDYPSGSPRRDEGTVEEEYNGPRFSDQGSKKEREHGMMKQR